jgi:hypothetical protein
MEFRIDCPCGEHVVVTEASAGATLTCACGRPISVPSLWELRVAAGLPAYDPGPELLIQHLLAAGKLPGTKLCLGCGFETEQVFEVRTECERSHVVDTGGSSCLTAGLIFWISPLWAAIRFFGPSDATQTEVLGRDTIFALPVPVCSDCHGTLRNRKRLKQSMQQIPEYRRLLEKFPWARVKLGKRIA